MGPITHAKISEILSSKTEMVTPSIPKKLSGIIYVHHEHRPAYTLGGTVTGLSGSGLVLQNNGADSLSITTDGSFAFAAPATEGTPYTITISQQPLGQTCVLTNNTGILGRSNVTNIDVTCSVALVSITVTPNNSRIPTNITEPFTATGHYADSSTADITSLVTWNTSNPAVASISITGLATGTSSGTAQISATLDGISGNTT